MKWRHSLVSSGFGTDRISLKPSSQSFEQLERLSVKCCYDLLVNNHLSGPKILFKNRLQVLKYTSISYTGHRAHGEISDIRIDFKVQPNPFPGISFEQSALCH